MTSLPINDLVHPSGTLKDRIGVLLHWPTRVTTSEPPEQNETADPGGPYPQLLIRKGVPVDGVLWLDTFVRRVEHLKREDRNRNPRQWTYGLENGANAICNSLSGCSNQARPKSG